MHTSSSESSHLPSLNVVQPGKSRGRMAKMDSFANLMEHQHKGVNVCKPQKKSYMDAQRYQFVSELIQNIEW